MKFEQILKNMPHTSTAGSLPHEILGLTSDSRQVAPGFAFFAIDGHKHRGFDFLPEAIQRGAVVVIAENPVASQIPSVAVPNIRQALAGSAATFYGHPSRHFYLAGITGTNGKTTLTYLLNHIWSDFNPGRIGTIDITYAGQSQKSKMTTPDSVDLQKIFAAMLAARTSHVAIEVSSHALEQFRTFGSDFDCGVFTNLTQDHFDYHGHIENYYQAKAKLFQRDLMTSTKKQKAAILNLDDAYGRRLATELADTNLTVYGYSATDPRATLFLNKYESTLAGTKFQITGFGQTVVGNTSLLGAYNMQNLMAALLVAQHAGLTLTVAAKKLESVSVPGRLQRIAGKNIFVDYAHTPDGLKNVLATLAAIKSKATRLIVVFGCGGDRDNSKRPLMGKIAAELADVVIITSDNPRTENAMGILKQIAGGVLQNKKTVLEVDRQKAIALALNEQKSDDIVLVAGKGHEDSQIIGNTALPFDDKTVIESLL